MNYYKNKKMKKLILIIALLISTLAISQKTTTLNHRLKLKKTPNLGTVDSLLTKDSNDIVSATAFTDFKTQLNLTDFLQDLIDDTTPQLGGNLDLNNFDITGIGNINHTGNITTSGTLQSLNSVISNNVTLSNYQNTRDDGVSLNYLFTDASGNLQSGPITNFNIPTLTSELTNDGEDGVNPFITANDLNPLLPLTVYIDTVNGNDLTGELGNANKPYQTDNGAYNDLPIDNGVLWTLYFLDSSIRDLSVIPNRPIKITTPNSGTFRFLNLGTDLEVNCPYFEIEAPYSILLFEDSVGISLRPSLLKINVRELHLKAFQSGFSGFFGSSASSLVDTGFIKCDYFYTEATSPVRLIGYSGYFIAERFESKTFGFRLRNDITTYFKLKVNEVISNTYTLTLESTFADYYNPIKKYSGTNLINDNYSQNLNVDDVIFSCPSFSYAGNGTISGTMSDLSYSLDINGEYIFNGFIGKITDRGSVTKGMSIVNSTIFLSSYLQNIGDHINLSAQTFNFSNSNFVQDAPNALWNNIDSGEGFNVNVYGSFKTNATGMNNGLGTVLTINKTPNTY